VTRIAVFGASGLVGATLVERFLVNRRYEVLPLIHSSGNAGRLARHRMELRSVDILSEREVRTALEGCTHVVNCTRGPNEVMIKGLRNLLRASRSAEVRRFVHLSSVAVYGEPPPADSIHEDAQARPVAGTYGSVKMQQDKMVLASCRRGLPSVILCPPNISGAYSPFLLNVLAAMREGRLALVDGGEAPCNLVDVQNLAKAIDLALFCEKAEGTRIFVTDGEETTWRQVAHSLRPLVDGALPLPLISRDEVNRMLTPSKKPQFSILSSVEHLISNPEVRSVLKHNPLLAKVAGVIRSTSRLLPKKFEDHLRILLSPRLAASMIEAKPIYDKRLCALQMRGVHHSCDRAKEILGYSADYSFAESMAAFRSWYEVTHGWNSDSWALLREL
jgi:nucleoside-diphosphate-sugar epimerase